MSDGKWNDLGEKKIETIIQKSLTFGFAGSVHRVENDDTGEQYDIHVGNNETVGEAISQGGFKNNKV
jgi:hypothetical protein